MRELALAADLAPATVTQMLDSLEAAGLVERVRSQRDRRVVLISLTERGAASVAARRARFEPLWRAALAEFGEDELHFAAAVLDRLREMFYDVADAEASQAGGPPRPAPTRSASRWKTSRRSKESADQSVSARPKASKRSEPNVVISAIAPSWTRRTSSLNAR